MAVSLASTHTWQLERTADRDTNSSVGHSHGPHTDSPSRRMEPSSPHISLADPSNEQAPSGPSPPGIPSPQAPGQLYPFQPPTAVAPQWTPSPNAAPFYPHFSPFFHPTATPPVAPQPPPQYFDPNQQIAWAYQQMMIQQAAMAQQHQQNQFNQAMAELGRARANSGPQQGSAQGTPNEFFPQPAAHQGPLIPGFPFQSGTPPVHPYSGTPNQSFRGRGPQQHLAGSRSNTFDNQDWNRLTAQGFPVPYARPDAAGSSHSISSSNGSAGGARTRTNSNNTNKSQTTPPASLRGQGHLHNQNSHGGSQSTPTRGNSVPQLTTDFERPRQPGRHGSSGPPSSANNRNPPHQRTVSNTSSDRTASSIRGQSSSSPPTVPTSSNNAVAGSSFTSASSAGQSTSSTSANSSPNMSRTNQRTPAKPSPLSQQQTFTDSSAASKRAKRLSKDDSELLPPTAVASALSARQSGLKGRFKRALAFTAPQALDEGADGGSSIGHGDISPNTVNGGLHVSDGDGGDIPSPVTPVNGDVVRLKPKSRAAQLFSGKFNASTDNISLSSTVSSASVMIRKLGSIGKLARRNTLTGITTIFKGDKNKGESGKKSKKADKSEPSVTHATAEVDRGMGNEDENLDGLTPAAMVARQHTLKSNAEAARRLREQAAATSAASAAAAMTGSNATSALPNSWEKNTTSRRSEASTSSRNVSEDGTLMEEKSDDGSGEGGYDPQFDADATIRMPAGVDLEDDDDEPWAIGLRRSIEKTRTPGKPVIKNHVGYVQEQHLDPPNQPFAARIRSNSYQTVAESQPGPLAHLPPPDPDHIDGLQRSSSTSNTPEKKPFSLPAFNFEIGDSIDVLSKEDGETDSPQDILSSSMASGSAGSGALASAADKGPTFAYTHPTANSSAPALSTMFNPDDKTHGPVNTPGGGHLSGMKKNISFAATLSIYDTFSSSAYDRRSEPSTANRLTPALAQRIKEELNSYKMEEMEVHSASKIHTHFFV